MADSERLNITLPKSMHREWKQAVEEREVAVSISALVRNSVNRNLDGNLEPNSTEAVAADASLDDEAMQYLERMDTTLTEVEKRLERVEDSSTGDGLPEGIEWHDLAIHLVPVFDPEPHQPMPSVPERGISTEDFAEKVNASEVAAESLLERLDREMGGIRSKTGGPTNTTYWWREF